MGALLAGAAVGLVVVLTGDGTRPPASPVVGGDIHSLVVDPTNPSRLFVGGHEAVAVSTDLGRTWQRVPTLDDADAMGWGFMDGRILVSGHPGISVSEDGGTIFESRNDGLPSTDVHCLGAGRSVIYGASPAVGVFASTDGGRSWQVRTDRAGHGFFGRLLVDPTNEDHVVAADVQNGAVESTDGGRTWTVLGGIPGATWVSWDPDDTNHIVVSAPGTAAVTRDAGRSWTPIEVPGDAGTVEMDPENPETLYAAALQGGRATIRLSRDSGGTWRRP